MSNHTTRTSHRAAQARVEVRDMKAATQGLPLSSRYVHIFYEVVMESVARWSEELALVQLVPQVYTSPRLLLCWTELWFRGALPVMAYASRTHKDLVLHLHGRHCIIQSLNFHHKSASGYPLPTSLQASSTLLVPDKAQALTSLSINSKSTIPSMS